MCGRFSRAKSPEVYGKLFDVPAVPDLPCWNIAPTQNVVVIRAQDNQKACAVMRWGMIPSWAKDKKTSYINARAETLADKPAFRTAFQRRRCLILADGYYEWKTDGKAKKPWYFRLADDTPFAFAGLWECWKGDPDTLESCTIITTSANELSRPIHDRMPVLLRGTEAAAWLDPAITNTDALTELLKPFPAGAMTAYPVGPAVGSFKNNSPLCTEPAQ